MSPNPGVPMARAATETQHAGLSGLEFGLAIPGTVGGAVWANAGAHDADVAAVLVGAGSCCATGPRCICRRPSSRSPTATAASSTRRPTGRAEIVVEATFALGPADAETINGRLDEIRRWRQAHQPLGLPSAGSVFRNPPDDSAGRLIEARGPQGHADRRRGRLREARQLRRQRPEGHGDGRAPTDGPCPCGDRRTHRGRPWSRRSNSSAIGPVGSRSHDQVRAAADARVPCSAVHPRSTTCPSCPARPSPRRLSGEGFAVEQVLIDLDGGWWLLPDDHRRDGRARRRRTTTRPKLAALGPLESGGDRPAGARAVPPVVFIALHGPFGEDGTSRGCSRPRARLHGVRRRRIGASAWTRQSSSGCPANRASVVEWAAVRS